MLHLVFVRMHALQKVPEHQQSHSRAVQQQAINPAQLPGWAQGSSAGPLTKATLFVAESGGGVGLQLRPINSLCYKQAPLFVSVTTCPLVLFATPRTLQGHQDSAPV